MPTVFQMDFPTDGPFGAERAELYKELAASIATEPGLLWKIWTENPTDRLAGGSEGDSLSGGEGADQASARAYAEMHIKRVEARGVTSIRALFFDVIEPLTAITRGPVAGAPSAS